MGLLRKSQDSNKSIAWDRPEEHQFSRAFRQLLVHHSPHTGDVQMKCCSCAPGSNPQACVLHVAGLENAGFTGTAG